LRARTPWKGPCKNPGGRKEADHSTDLVGGRHEGQPRKKSLFRRGPSKITAPSRRRRAIRNARTKYEINRTDTGHLKLKSGRKDCREKLRPWMKYGRRSYQKPPLQPSKSSGDRMMMGFSTSRGGVSYFHYKLDNSQRFCHSNGCRNFRWHGGGTYVAKGTRRRICGSRPPQNASRSTLPSSLPLIEGDIHLQRTERGSKFFGSHSPTWPSWIITRTRKRHITDKKHIC